MDNINIRRNRRSGEVERLRMWTDTEFENMDMYSRVKRRRKSLRRNSYGIQNHHEVSTEGEEEESQEEDGDIEAEEAEGEENDRPYNLRQRKTVERYQAPPIGNIFKNDLCNGNNLVQQYFTLVTVLD
uniref:Uncharacterized protein n=2 Tax=Micrurus lemniscatus lemniscatus TaxID=129467 RepID=A0A2D4HGG3_MICLE